MRRLIAWGGRRARETPWAAARLVLARPPAASRRIVPAQGCLAKPPSAGAVVSSGPRASIDRRVALEPLVLIEEFDIAIDSQEVLRMMGVPKRGGGRAGNAPSKAVDLCEELKDKALSLVEARSAYVLCRSAEVGYHEVFRRADRLAFAVCTIGPRLEFESLRRAEDGSSLDALVLDAMGTVAVESVAEGTAGVIRARAAELGLKGGVRFSPGYGKWPWVEQRSLFNIIDGGVVGVKLNSSCIMEPRKSVSFAMRIGVKPDAR
jgi:hypothetical protein